MKANKTDCDVCKLLLTTETESSGPSIMSVRDVGARLVHASAALCHDVQEAVNLAKVLLPRIIHRDGVGRLLSEAVKKQCNFTWAECNDHKNILSDHFLTFYNRVTIHQFCRLKNREKLSVYSAQANRRRVQKISNLQVTSN